MPLSTWYCFQTFFITLFQEAKNWTNRFLSIPPSWSVTPNPAELRGWGKSRQVSEFRVSGVLENGGMDGHRESKGVVGMLWAGEERNKWHRGHSPGINTPGLQILSLSINLLITFSVNPLIYKRGKMRKLPRVQLDLFFILFISCVCASF